MYFVILQSDCNSCKQVKLETITGNIFRYVCNNIIPNTVKQSSLLRKSIHVSQTQLFLSTLDHYSISMFCFQKSSKQCKPRQATCIKTRRKIVANRRAFIYLHASPVQQLCLVVRSVLIAILASKLHVLTFCRANSDPLQLLLNLVQ